MIAKIGLVGAQSLEHGCDSVLCCVRLCMNVWTVTTCGFNNYDQYSIRIRLSSKTTKPLHQKYSHHLTAHNSRCLNIKYSFVSLIFLHDTKEKDSNCYQFYFYFSTIFTSISSIDLFEEQKKVAMNRNTPLKIFLSFCRDLRFPIFSKVTFSCVFSSFTFQTFGFTQPLSSLQ